MLSYVLKFCLFAQKNAVEAEIRGGKVSGILGGAYAIWGGGATARVPTGEGRGRWEVCIENESQDRSTMFEHLGEKDGVHVKKWGKGKHSIWKMSKNPQTSIKKCIDHLEETFVHTSCAWVEILKGSLYS